VTNDWFIKNNLTIPYKIHSCKGKKAKIKRLIELNKKYDYCFYIDNEQEYLEYAWIFGLKTFIYKNNNMINIYEVGGSVRDRLLGLESKDKDFVVVFDDVTIGIDKAWGRSKLAEELLLQISKLEEINKKLNNEI
jgi:hypothetical protein